MSVILNDLPYLQGAKSISFFHFGKDESPEEVTETQVEEIFKKIPALSSLYAGQGRVQRPELLFSFPILEMLPSVVTRHINSFLTVGETRILERTNKSINKILKTPKQFNDRETQVATHVVNQEYRNQARLTYNDWTKLSVAQRINSTPVITDFVISPHLNKIDLNNVRSIDLGKIFTCEGYLEMLVIPSLALIAKIINLFPAATSITWPRYYHLKYTLRDAESEIDKQLNSVDFSRFESIRVCHFPILQSYMLTQCASTVECLDLNISRVTAETFTCISRMESLVKLSLCSVYSLSNERLSLILMNKPRLKILEISGCSELLLEHPDNFLSSILPTSVEELNIGHLSIGAKVFELFSRIFPKVHSLCLSTGSSEPYHFLHHAESVSLLSSFTCLKSLNVSGMCLPAAALNHFPTALTCLNLSDMSFKDGDTTLMPLRNFTKLRELNTSCTNVTGTFLAYLPPKLEVLDSIGCSHWTTSKQDVIRLKNKRPYLKVSFTDYSAPSAFGKESGVSLLLFLGRAEKILQPVGLRVL